MIFGVFTTAYQLSMALNLAQQGLKKSLKILKFHDPEPVETLYFEHFKDSTIFKI